MRRQRRIPFPGWAPVLIFSILVSGSGRAEEPVQLESLLKIAQEANPAIQAAALHAAAFETIIPAAGAWDDPRLSFNIINVPWKTLDFAQAPMTGKQIQLMQRIPLPGITRLRTERARQSATLADFSHAELRNMVRQQVQILDYNHA